MIRLHVTTDLESVLISKQKGRPPEVLRLQVLVLSRLCPSGAGPVQGTVLVS